ncbi:MAG: serine protease [Candidatus Dormibacteraeota bacterium]|nr:serine protease [Candidatus Dormibacteraeota bacterium]
MAGFSKRGSCTGRGGRGLLTTACAATVLIGAVVAPPSSVRASAADTPAIRRAVAIAAPSVVFVVVRITGSVLESRDGLLHGPLVATSKGTGWFVNPAGVFVTATHVVAPSPDDVKVALVDRYIVAITGAQLTTDSPQFAAYLAATTVRNAVFSVRVITQGMQVPPGVSDAELFSTGRPATVLASSPISSTDVSVLAISGRDEPAVLVSTSSTPVGAPLGIIGYPKMSPSFSVTPTYTFGQLTSFSHGSEGIGLPSDATTAGIAADATVLGVDAYAEHGDSGGPAVDEQARADGLVSFGSVTGQPIFLVSSADISRVLSGAHQVNALGPSDRAWRAGLAAYDSGALRAALDDFRSCTAISQDNTGCRSWSTRVAGELAPSHPGPPWVTLTAGGAGLLVLIVVLAVALPRWRRARAA